MLDSSALSQAQVESQTAMISSSSDQAEDTPTPEDDHVTSPSPSPDDDGANGGGACFGGQEDEQQGGKEEGDNEKKNQDDDKDNGKAGFAYTVVHQLQVACKHNSLTYSLSYCVYVGTELPIDIVNLA